MLLSFRFGNHRSFRDEQQLNLTPLYGGPAHSPSVDAVPVVGIFGANASGKSNCLDALSLMRRMAIHSDRDVEPGMGISRQPFRLDADSMNEPSRYVVDLLLGESRYTYGFTIDGDRVLEEWLYYYPLHRKRRVFEREGDRFSWGEESGRRGDLERIAEITAPTALFLSTVARFGKSGPASEPEDPQPLHSVYRWFLRHRDRIRLGPSRVHRYVTGGPLPRWEEDRPVIVDLLRAADVGIDVIFKGPAGSQVPLISALGEAETESPLWIRMATRDNTPSRRRRLLFSHRGTNGNFALDLEDESTGTQQLFDLAIDASFVLRGGGTMTVDEIDASLHPMLTAKLIALFHNGATNPRRSQLIFTSHDASLLGTFDTEEVLRRDEIWFTEKDEYGASTLYPLSDFKPRKDGENRQRRYLNGNYGGVPDLSTYLFEQALASRGARHDVPTT